MFGIGKFVKFLCALTLLLLTGLASQMAHAQFVHPGGLHTQADLDRMKAKVAAGESPWIDDWNLLIADSQAQSTYTAAPRANLGASRQRADADAHAAYLNAIRWYISGDTRYADNAVAILNGWSAAVNQVPTGTDIPGLSGIPIQDFALAAEVLRIYPGWSAVDQQRFKDMNTNYFYPVVHDFLVNHLSTDGGNCISHYWANWDAANIGALIAMAVFNDNVDWFADGVAYFYDGAGNGSIKNAVAYRYGVNGELGQWQESGRDQEHAQLGVGLLGYAAQVAWNQGIDLFGHDNNRLLAGAEYVARYNQAKDVPYTEYNNCDNVRNMFPAINGRGRLDDRPVWELLYNHYGVRQGLATPNTRAMAELMRPEHGSIDHFGYGTLTFTLDADKSPWPVAPVPIAPTGVIATAGSGRVWLDWNPVPTATGYRVQRATAVDGPYTTIVPMSQTTWHQYTDYSVSNGTSYYYRVLAENQAGLSAESAASTVATPLAATSALLTGWASADVGTVDAAGSTAYSPAGNNTFVVTGQGRGIGGTNDSFHYAYRQVTGDFTFIARLTDVDGVLSETGLMMRESLADNAPAVTVTNGDIGWRYTWYGARASAGAQMAWDTGNQYTWRPFAWYKLTRAGNVFTAYQSNDGLDWHVVATTEIPMATTYYVGLAASSADATQFRTETSTFDFVGSALPRPDYTISPSPVSQMVNPGQSTRYAFAVTGLYGFAGNVKLEARGFPLGVTGRLSSNMAKGPAEVTLDVATNVATKEGTYPLTVVGKHGNQVRMGTANLVVTKPNFSLTATPATQSINPGDTAMVYADVAALANFTGMVDLSVSGLPGGTTAAFDTSTINTSGTAALTILTSSATPVGSYTLTFTGSGGGLTHTAVAVLTITDVAIPPLVAYLKFDEASGTLAADSTGNGWNGTLSGGATRTSSTHGKAVKLSGSGQYVDMVLNSKALTGDYTIAAWVNLNVAANNGRIFDFSRGTPSAGAGSYMYLTTSNGSAVRFAITIKGYNNEQGINGTAALPTGGWHHVAVTLSGTVATLYVDKVAVGTNTNMTLRPTNLGITSANYIGRSAFSADAYLNGAVDEFRIYAGALTPEQISSLP